MSLPSSPRYHSLSHIVTRWAIAGLGTCSLASSTLSCVDESIEDQQLVERNAEPMGPIDPGAEPGPIESGCGPGYCVGSSFCDDCACYSEDAPISQAACVHQLIDPSCGIGECINGGYCDGLNCPDAGVCWESGSEVSQIMCGGDDDDDCGPGQCIDGSFCDDCACYSPDAPISLAACAQGLLDPGCGIGECIDGGYCDGPHCPDTGVCWAPDSDVSQLMCGGDVFPTIYESMASFACKSGYRVVITRDPKGVVTQVKCVWDGSDR